MLGKNIKYYRKLRKFTQEELGNRAKLSKMSISYYEAGTRTPDSSTLKLLADALGVSSLDLLRNSGKQITISHGSFRQAKVSDDEKEVVQEQITRYFQRFFNIVEILGRGVLPDPPNINPISCSFGPESVDQAAQYIRKQLGLSELGPIPNLVDVLENQGFLVCTITHLPDKVFGLNGSVNGYPYIAINKKNRSELHRHSLAHELAHMICDKPCDMDEEKFAGAVAGAFFFPTNDVLREFGPSRTFVSESELREIQKEYGISMKSAICRMKECKIISRAVEGKIFGMLTNKGLRNDECSNLPKEEPRVFKQFVLRAVAEEEINMQKAAELLEMSIQEFWQIYSSMDANA